MRKFYRSDFNLFMHVGVGVLSGSLVTSILFFDKATTPLNMIGSIFLLGFPFALILILLDKKLKERGE